MKTIDWQRYLQEQHRDHGKTLFTVPEMANIARTTNAALNVELARLTRRQVIARYARGLYGLPDSATSAQLLRNMDPHAYITAAAALFHHGMVTQSPAAFTCFTDRRHNRSRERDTPLGRFILVCVGKPVYHPPADLTIAPPEQALCDFVYLMRRKGVPPESVVTFRNLNRLRKSLLKRVLVRYPRTVREHVKRLMPGKSSD